MEEFTIAGDNMGRNMKTHNSGWDSIFNHSDNKDRRQTKISMTDASNTLTDYKVQGLNIDANNMFIKIPKPILWSHHQNKIKKVQLLNRLCR